MNESPDKPVYIKFDSSISKKQFLEDLIDKYSDSENFKKDFIDFILSNSLENYLSQEIIISENIFKRQIKLYGIPSVRTVRELITVTGIFKKIHEITDKADFPYSEIPPALFYRKGNTVMEISLEMDMSEESGFENVSFDIDSFSVEKSERLVIYKAHRNGYLCFNGKNFSITNPVKKSNEKASVSIVYLPVIYRRKELLDYIYDWLSQFSGKYPEAPFLEIPERNILENSEALSFTAVEGKNPVPGRDAEIENLFFKKDRQPAAKGPIDHKSYKRYTVVEKDQLLLRKLKKVDAEPGIDIFGSPIECIDSNDVEIISEGLIRIEESGDYVNYHASSDGLFTFKDNCALLEEVMIVRGNVDYKTGNIDFPNNVNIQGDVVSGFSVKSGKNIIVDGCIDNGAFVKCSGDLTVVKGIIGEKTRIECGSDVYANYFSDAELYCKGKTVVEKYMIGGSVFSEKDIEVIGSGIKSSSVFGGKYYSMGNILLHSAGNANRSTLITSGYNPYLDFKHSETIKACAAVDFEISNIINILYKEYGLSDDLEKAKKLPQAVKKVIVEKLKKLKELKETRNRLTELGNKLQDDIYLSDSSGNSITIQNYLIPDVEIQINRDNKIIREKKGAETFKPEK